MLLFFSEQHPIINRNQTRNHHATQLGNCYFPQAQVPDIGDIQFYEGFPFSHMTYRKTNLIV